MPNYNTQVRPYSIFPGDVALAFNAEAPAAGQASQQFALPSYAGFPENGRTIRWQISFATAPTSVNIQLQTAINDVDAQYAVLTGAANMSSALTVGRQSSGYRGARELRASEGDYDFGWHGRDGTDSRLRSRRRTAPLALGNHFPHDAFSERACSGNVWKQGAAGDSVESAVARRSIVDGLPRIRRHSRPRLTVAGAGNFH